MEDKMYRCSFEEISKNPDKNRKLNGFVYHAVNAVAIADNLSWKEAVQRLAECAHQLAILPDQRECVNLFLQNAGFVRTRKPKGWQLVEDVCEEAGLKYHNGEELIVAAGSDRRIWSASVLLPDENGIYHSFGIRDSRKCDASEIWVRNGENAGTGSGKGRIPSPRKTINRKPDDHTFFQYTMKNPNGRYVGDCVIRGLSAVLGISWHEVLDQLLACTDYTCLAVNTSGVYNRLLSREGYIRHKRPVNRYGKSITGKEFCVQMEDECFYGERVFAHIGRSHVIAVMPGYLDNRFRYHIEDTWDSSDGKIGEYWVEDRKPRENVKKSSKNPEIRKKYQIGQMITHPKYGEGKILELGPDEGSRSAAVEFFGDKVRIISLKWLDRKLQQ